MQQDRMRLRSGRSALAAALLVIVVFGAIGATAAQATPIRRINGGETFEEAGIVYKDFALTESSVRFMVHGEGWNIECKDVSASGVLRVPANGTSSWIAKECEMLESTTCSVLPFEFSTAITLSEDASKTVIQRFAPPENIIVIPLSGESCWLGSRIEIETYGQSFGAYFSPSYEQVMHMLKGSKSNLALHGGEGAMPITVWLQGATFQYLFSEEAYGAW